MSREPRDEPHLLMVKHQLQPRCQHPEGFRVSVSRFLSPRQVFVQTQPSKPDARIIQAHTKWTEDAVKVNAVDTVVVDSSGNEIDPSEAEGLVARPLPRTERMYYRQEGDEEAAPRNQPQFMQHPQKQATAKQQDRRH